MYINELVEDDYVYICGSLFPSIPKSVLLKVISFNRRLHEDTMLHHKFAQNGSPWEFNLRDVIRSCQLIKGLIHFYICLYIFFNKRGNIVKNG